MTEHYIAFHCSATRTMYADFRHIATIVQPVAVREHFGVPNGVGAT